MKQQSSRVSKQEAKIFGLKQEEEEERNIEMKQRLESAYRVTVLASRER